MTIEGRLSYGALGDVLKIMCRENGAPAPADLPPATLARCVDLLSRVADEIASVGEPSDA